MALGRAASALAPFDYGAYENAQNRAMSAYQTAAPLEAQQWNQAMGMGLSAFGLGAPLEAQQWRTVMAEAVRQLEDSPPLDFDGHLVCPVAALRKLLRLQLHRVAAVIESQNHARH